MWIREYRVWWLELNNSMEHLYLFTCSRQQSINDFIIGFSVAKTSDTGGLVLQRDWEIGRSHYGDVTMGAIASQITSLTIVYSTVYSDADQRKHQSAASLAFVQGIHRGPVNSPHKWPVTRKMFPFDDVIMVLMNGSFSSYVFLWRLPGYWIDGTNSTLTLGIYGVYPVTMSAPNCVFIANWTDGADEAYPVFNEYCTHRHYPVCEMAPWGSEWQIDSP